MLILDKITKLVYANFSKDKKMKKLISVLLILLCLSFAFAASSAGAFKPYLKTLDLHPAILNGFCPTYVGVGGDYAFYLSNGDVAHINISGAGGITERMLFQQPTDGEYLVREDETHKIQLVDVTSFEWDIKGVYELGQYLSFTIGYKGVTESRADSMLITNKFWPKNQKTQRWLGGSVKRDPSKMEDWLSSFGATRDTTVYPELKTNNSLYNTIYAETKFDNMIDTMVTNEGFWAEFAAYYTPAFLNRDADLISLNFDVVGAKTFINKQFANGLNMFSMCIIDRIDVNYTTGSKVPSYFQEPISLGRKVRGFNTGSYASEFTAVNNFEIRFSGPEARKGIFARTDFFFDAGIGLGKIFNADSGVNNVKNILVSVGVQEMIDYNDAFDLGIQAAYLIKGQNASNPLKPLQISATFFLDF